MQDQPPQGKRDGRRGWWLLLIVPVVGPLWVPFYNRLEPSFIGLPFFYWYQFLWVIISVAITLLVYRMTRDIV